MNKQYIYFFFLLTSIFAISRNSFSDPILEEVSILSSNFFMGRSAGTIGAERTADYLSYRFKELGLEPFQKNDHHETKVRKKDFLIPFTCVLDSTISTQSIQGNNVVGIIRGNHSSLKNEYIVIGAHFDHIGFGGKLSYLKSRDSVLHPGADDNASGIAALLTIARSLQSKKDALKRSVLVVAFDAEEWNAKGSEALVKQFLQSNTHIVAMINLDMVGRLDSLKNLIVYGTKTSPQWEPLLEKRNLDFQFQLSKINDGFGAGDHLPFYRQSIPFLFFFTGAHTDYHRPTDVATKINSQGIEMISQWVTSLVIELSQIEEAIAFTPLPEKVVTKRSNKFHVYVGVIPDFKNTEKGFFLLGATEHSPAHRAGVQSGDQVIEFDGKPVNSLQDYMTILDQHHPGDEVTMVVLRNNEPITLKIVIGMK
ncbi:MAG: M20/M25/M40 family metallo-hydrolase [bacterium]|nr:M20/M25/M40 family metallo-hydrolase [bacterium]